MKSDRLFRVGSLYLIATLAPTLTLIGVTPLVTRSLGAASYGAVAISITVYQLAAVFLALGLPTAITRNAILDPGGYSAATGVVVMGSALAVVLGLALAVTSSLWGSILFPVVPAPVLGAGALSGAGLAIVTMSQAVFRASERPAPYVALAMGAALLPPLLGLTLTRVQGPTPQSYVFGLASGYALVATVAVVAAIRHTRPRYRLSDLRSALRLGLPTLPHLASLPALSSASLAIVATRSGVIASAELQIAVLVGTSVLTVLNAFNNAWAPMIMKTPSDTRPEALRQSTSAIAWALLALLGAYALLGPIVVRFVGGPVVQDAMPVRASFIVAAAATFHLLYLANIHLTFIAGRTAPLAISSPTSAVVAVLYLWLLPIGSTPVDLLAYAFAWPLFFAVQALMSYVLARNTPYPTTNFKPSGLPLVLCVGVCAVGASGSGLFGQITAGVMALALSAGYAFRSKSR